MILLFMYTEKRDNNWIGIEIDQNSRSWTFITLNNIEYLTLFNPESSVDIKARPVNEKTNKFSSNLNELSRLEFKEKLK